MFAYGFDFAEIIAYEINLAVSLIVLKKKRLNVLKIFLGDFIFKKKNMQIPRSQTSGRF